MDLFREDNTDGYTAEQLECLNTEANTRIPQLMTDYGLSKDEAEKTFANEVSHR